MLWNASRMKGYSLSASDGQIGTISDFLFDDENWHVRWLVVETGHWLAGRKVLLPSSAVSHLDQEHQDCSIKLTMQQIKDSPDSETERPVSRQMEASVYGHYGYMPYWNGGSGFTGGIGYVGGYGFTNDLSGGFAPPSNWESEVETADARRKNDDVHLRSVNEVIGYHIHASDGRIGHVEDFLIEDPNWSIRYLVADTKNWWPDKQVLISPRSVTDVDWSVQLVNVDVDRQKIKGAPAYDASMPIDRNYEEKFRRHYEFDLADA
jgi:hypothetical protein